MRNYKLRHIVFFFLVSIFLLITISGKLNQMDAKSITDAGLIDIIVETDNGQEIYSFVADYEGEFPVHVLPPGRPERNDKYGFTYLDWAGQSTLLLNTLPENDFPQLVSGRYGSGALSSMDEPSDFIYRYQMDGVNLFGGGYLPYVDFYSVSSQIIPPDDDFNP